MILLLSSASEPARALVADKVLDEHKDWRHLALEDLEIPEDIEPGIGEMVSVLVACECAKEVHEEGLHVLITCPHLFMKETVEQEFPKQVVSVYLGKPEQPKNRKVFQHILDSGEKSVGETYKYLKRLIEKSQK